MNSTLATLYQDRFEGFAYLAVGYVPPNPEYDVDAVNALTESIFGYPSYGYWYFLNEDDAYKTIADHV